jgi:predicted deacylase
MKKKRAAAGSRRAPKESDGNFDIGGVSVAPGTVGAGSLDLAWLYIQEPIRVPLHVFHGATPGPTLFVSACIHGDEVNSIPIVRGVLDAIDPAKLRGTVVAIPVVNAFGLLHQTRYLPDRRDLNRSFPGSKRGSLSSRVARAFFDGVVARCTHGIDLHTGALQRSNLPQVRANLNDPVARGMADAFGSPITVHASLRDGSLREAAGRRRIPCVLFEAGEALRHDAAAVEIGIRGILAVMAHLGMQPAAAEVAPTTVRCWESSWVRAEWSGFFVPSVKLGDHVLSGHGLGSISVRHGGGVAGTGAYTVIAPREGMVIGRLENPLVTQGDALLHIASVTEGPRRRGFDPGDEPG